MEEAKRHRAVHKIKAHNKKIIYGLIAVFIALTAVNQYLVLGIQQSVVKSSSVSTSASVSTGSASLDVMLNEILPKGIPALYGKELAVSFDDISAANPQKADEIIGKLAVFDNRISLSEDELQRYVNVGLNISCEYCCGAQAIIFENGQAACGCAHSYAMRGLAKYLIKNHGEMSDEQILAELGKWKTLFFPTILAQKALILQSKGIDYKDYINLASNKYRGIESGAASGGMIGGC